MRIRVAKTEEGTTDVLLVPTRGRLLPPLYLRGLQDRDLAQVVQAAIEEFGPRPQPPP